MLGGPQGEPKGSMTLLSGKALRLILSSTFYSGLFTRPFWEATYKRVGRGMGPAVVLGADAVGEEVRGSPPSSRGRSPSCHSDSNASCLAFGRSTAILSQRPL